MHTGRQAGRIKKNILYTTRNPTEIELNFDSKCACIGKLGLARLKARMTVTTRRVVKCIAIVQSVSVYSSIKASRAIFLYRSMLSLA